MKQKKEKMYI